MSAQRRVFVIGADGLRPDQIDADTMPNLAKLIAQGVRFTDHHSVYPTHTRVVASSFSTGRTPGQHGIVANTMIVPFATEDHIIDTGDYRHLDAIASVDAGGTQLAESLSDTLVRSGARVAVAGNGSSGSNVLWTFKDRGRIVNTSSTYAIADLYDLRDKLGPVPEKTVPNLAQIRYATSAVTDIFLRDPDARVITLWLAEPDSSLHYFGIGSPEVNEALKGVDECLGRVLDAMDREGIRDQFDIMFLSDHGHSTVKAHRTLREYLGIAKQELGDGMPSLVTASDYIYAIPGDDDPTADQLAPLVEWLYAQAWVDIVLGGVEGSEQLDGVIPLRDIWNGHINHRRPLLGVSPRWTHEANGFGVPGSVASLTTQSALRSSHGSLSPYDLHCTFIASGPSFREGVSSSVPTGVIDILPTILALLDLPTPDGIDGRVVSEAFADSDGDPDVVDYELGNDGRTVRMHRVGATTYIHGASSGGEYPVAD